MNRWSHPVLCTKYMLWWQVLRPINSQRACASHAGVALHFPPFLSGNIRVGHYGNKATFRSFLYQTTRQRNKIVNLLWLSHVVTKDDTVRNWIAKRIAIDQPQPHEITMANRDWVVFKTDWDGCCRSRITAQKRNNWHANQRIATTGLWGFESFFFSGAGLLVESRVVVVVFKGLPLGIETRVVNSNGRTRKHQLSDKCWQRKTLRKRVLRLWGFCRTTR